LRERVDRGLAADFATAGVSHVVAISGWNIAIVAALAGALLRGRPRRIVGIATGGVIVGYVVAAGASPSVVRAAVMAGVVLLARGSGRAVRAPAALSLAAAGLLLLDPAMIGDAGFRLSVMATAGLLAWATPIGTWLGGLWGGRIPGWLAEGLGITLAAQAATLPDVLATFGRLSLVAPAVNLVVVPMVPAAMAGGGVALLGGWLVQLGAPSILGVFAGLPGWLLLHVMVAAVRIAAALPYAALALPPDATVPAASASLALMVGLIAIVRWRARRGRRAIRRSPPPRAPSRASARRSPSTRRVAGPPTPLERAALACAAIAIAVAVLAAADVAGRPDRLVMLDVGQGDAILVESRDGARMLVDGGPDPDRVLAELDAVIPPWDRRVDIVVLTHPHEDHVAGLVRVLERYRVGRVFEPGMHGSGAGWRAWDAALRQGPPRALLAAGAQLTIGDIRLEVRWPEPGTVPTAPGATGRDINDVSIVLLGTASGRRFLLTGDAEEDVDPALLSGGLPRLDVLKVAHHGSATATSAALLAATSPSIALISVGAGNDYGHPAPSTLARLRDVGAHVYRTDLDGRIEADLRPAGVEVHASGSRGPAAAPRTGYDRSHDRPPAPRGGEPAALARAARLVPAPRLRRGRRGGVARRPRLGSGHARGPARGGGCSPAARCGQAAQRRGGRPPPPRRRFCRVVGRARSRGARPAGPRPSRDAPSGRRAGVAPGRCADRGTPGRVRGQARRTAPRVDGRAVRVLATPLPVRTRCARAPRRGRSDGGGLGRCDGSAGDEPRPRARARGLHAGGRRARGRAASPLVASSAARGCGHAVGGRAVSTADRPQIVYLWGDDEWAMERLVAALADGLARDTGAQPDRWRADGREVTADAIAERVAIAPMFGGGTVAVVSNPTQLVRSKALRDALDGVIASVAPGNALVFLEFDTTGGRRRPKSLLDLEAGVQKAGGTARPCRAPGAGEMPAWIAGRATEMGIALGPEAAREIARRIGSHSTGGDVDRRQMSAIAVGELEKLNLYRGSEPVTVEDVRALVPELAADSLWALSDAVASRRTGLAGPALDRVLETQPEQVVLVMLHRRLRELLIAADARAAGAKPAELVKLIGGSPYVVQRRAEQSSGWTVRELESALDGLLELDRMAKHADSVATTEGQRRMAWIAWLAEHVASRSRAGGPQAGSRPG
jgi:competence protein ComEC